MKKRKKLLFCGILAAVFLGLILWGLWENTALELNFHILSSPRVPESFSGFRIAHISDLHNAEMGPDNEKLLSVLREAQPDLIAITGDLIDSRNTDIETALEFAREAVKIAPCYYVTGNHEARVAEYALLKAGLEEAGVTVLENARAQITREGETLTVLGVQDPSFCTGYLFGDDETVMDTQLTALRQSADGYTVLLSHRPELFSVYLSHGIDLTLSGHAHGGQFRLPFLGGLIAPNQGLFPQYDSGLYTEGNANLIVSRGIGNSILPLRINNPPEVILIQLIQE